MIKILHYCWFGKNPLPPKVVEYMKSWEKFCPDFVIKRWDETNFDIDSVPFVKEAYKAKKWAFVSDYVRTYALYSEGGLYVDTDVEFIKPIDDLLNNSFMGFENPDIVSPGVILYASSPKQAIYGEILNYYADLHYNDEIKSEISSPNIYTQILENHGLKKNNTIQNIDGIVIYPTEYFQPLGDARYGIKKKFTSNTRTIHHYDASWLTTSDKEYFLYKKNYGELKGKILFTLRHPIVGIKKLKSGLSKRSQTGLPDINGRDAVCYDKRHSPSFYVIITLMIYTVFYYYYKAYLESMLGDPFRYLPIILNASIAVFVFSMLLFGRRDNIKKKPLTAFFVFLICVMMSFAVTLSGFQKILGLCSMLLSILIFQVYPIKATEQKFVYKLFIIAVLSLLINGATVDNMEANPQKFNPNTCGFLLTLLFCISTVRYFSYRHISDWVLMCFCLFLQLVFESRTAMLGCIMFAVIYLIFGRRNKAVKSSAAFWIILVCSVLGLIVAYIYSEVLFPLIGHGKIFIFGKDIFTGRQTIWNFAFQSIKDHFWFGVGSNLNSDKLEEGYYASIINAHNQPLGMLAAFGIFAFVGFYVALSYYVSNRYLQNKNIKSYCSSAVLIYIAIITVMSYFEIYFLSEYNWLPIVIGYGLVFGTSRKTFKKGLL